MPLSFLHGASRHVSERAEACPELETNSVRQHECTRRATGVRVYACTNAPQEIFSLAPASRRQPPVLSNPRTFVRLSIGPRTSVRTYECTLPPKAKRWTSDVGPRTFRIHAVPSYSRTFVRFVPLTIPHCSRKAYVSTNVRMDWLADNPRPLVVEESGK